MQNESYKLRFEVSPQPTETSCGPTCLQSLYAFYGDRVPIETLMKEIPELEAGGTLAVYLGVHALKRGYRVRLYTYNLHVFDPTWFAMDKAEFRRRLATQKDVRKNRKLRAAAAAYLEFVDLGGEVRMEDLSGRLIRKYLKRDQPILTGLSSTFLYRTAREIQETDTDDDILGEPSGHFAILSGYDQAERMVSIADPYEQNPLSPGTYYEVGMERLTNAILLGVLTYDANLLIIQPKQKHHA